MGLSRVMSCGRVRDSGEDALQPRAEIEVVLKRHVDQVGYGFSTFLAGSVEAPMPRHPDSVHGPAAVHLTPPP